MVSLGPQAVELAASAGLHLDDWQTDPLVRSLERREDGRWRRNSVGLIVPRQNGKGGVIEARALAGLFLDPDCRLCIYSAHEFATSLEAFWRLLGLIEESDLQRHIKRVSRAHGEEGLELVDGSRIRFRTRTKGGGRGMSCDLLFLDECMILSEFAYGALLPTQSARSNPQTWYCGSAVDQVVHEHGVVLARIRERGIAGDDDLVYVEHAADIELDELLDDPSLLDDRELWAQANPALGGRITYETVARERKSLSPRTFAVERLGAGDWPITDPLAASLIDAQLWASLTDAQSTVLDPVSIAFDVTPDRSRSTIAIAGRRQDGLLHVEIVEAREGTGWVANRVAEIAKRHDAKAVRCDASGPAGSLLPALAALGIVVQAVSAKEHAQAAGAFFDAVAQKTLRHMGTAELAGAVAGAAKRQLGDAWAWARTKTTVDISPLVAVTLAAWDSEPTPAGVWFYGWG